MFYALYPHISLRLPPPQYRHRPGIDRKVRLDWKLRNGDRCHCPLACACARCRTVIRCGV